MATAVGVMDEPRLSGNTDVLVVADASSKLLLWIPRDLWCGSIGERVNRAFAIAGHDGLVSALGEHGFELDASLVLDRRAAERALDRVTVTVPVAERAEFWYPDQPGRPIEEGRKRVAFEPPAETLEGERIHQWLGARYAVRGPGGDANRIVRQQVLLRCLLEQGFDFRPVLEAEEQLAVSGPALEDLGLVDSGFLRTTFATEAVSRTIDGKEVLVFD